MQFLVVLLFLSIPVIWGSSANVQERFDSGPHKGFTKSRTEQMIVEIGAPFEVRTVHGVVQFRKHEGEPLPDALFEIRDDSSGKVRGVFTNKEGRFKISHVPVGTYSFKATKDGYQSVVGKIIVSKKAGRESLIKFEMPLGV